MVCRIGYEDRRDRTRHFTMAREKRGWCMNLSMRRLVFLAVGFLAMAAQSASASVTNFVTPTGSTVGGNPVNASATFTTSADTVTVVLTNLQADPKSVVQNLSDL